jgi:hypothetical protein
MTTTLERLDQSFSLVSTLEAREILGGLAESSEAVEEEAAIGGFTLCNPSNTSGGGVTVTDKDRDDTWG